MATVSSITVQTDEEFDLPRWAEIIETKVNDDDTITIFYLTSSRPGPRRPGPPRR